MSIHGNDADRERLDKLLEISDSFSNNEALSRVEVEEEADGYRQSDYRHRLFVIEYCKDLNGSRAAAAAGYAEKHSGVRSTELLKKPQIQEAIARRLRALAVSSAVTREWILTELVDTYEQLSTNSREDITIKLKTLELITKLMGYGNPDVQVNMQTNIDSIKVEIVKRDGN